MSLPPNPIQSHSIQLIDAQVILVLEIDSHILRSAYSHRWRWLELRETSSLCVDADDAERNGNGNQNRSICVFVLTNKLSVSISWCNLFYFFRFVFAEFGVEQCKQKKSQRPFEIVRCHKQNERYTSDCYQRTSDKCFMTTKWNVYNNDDVVVDDSHTKKMEAKKSLEGILSLSRFGYRTQETMSDK